jgi:exportin-7
MSEINPEIYELEKLCEQLYSSNSAQQIQEANKLLENFSNSTNCLHKCQILLDRGAVRF